jgi:hypothetical protein
MKYSCNKTEVLTLSGYHVELQVLSLSPLIHNLMIFYLKQKPVHAGGFPAIKIEVFVKG